MMIGVSGVIFGIFGAATLAVLIYLMVRSGDASAEKPKTVRRELEADGVRDLVAEERIDEAVDLYRKFAGVDEYTARDAVERIKQEIT
jgi:hypothetical protein